ncbi:MAG: arginine N-succinyltransferase [Opitutaceae bacterium]
MNGAVVRPVRPDDLDALVEMAGAIRGGMTSLPPDRDVLAQKIDESLRAFDARIRKPGGEFYLFVLEEGADGAIAGTAGIVARVGGFDPFYSYEIRHETFSHEPLNLNREVEVLHLKTNHKGPSEVCSLYLRPASRRSGRGRLLSLSRFLFMAMFPQRFDREVLSEMRGFIDESGRSPFWESVGRHFFQNDFATADFLSGLGNKSFIEDLMPEYPIYVTLLPEEVQKVIGRVHPATEPALRLLHEEGFTFANEVDIFDAGPLLRAETRKVRTIASSRVARLESIGEIGERPVDSLIAWGGLDFRCCLGAAEAAGEGRLSIRMEDADKGSLKPGDEVRVSPLRG